jgi:hypothetical protein
MHAVPAQLTPNDWQDVIPICVRLPAMAEMCAVSFSMIVRFKGKWGRRPDVDVPAASEKAQNPGESEEIHGISSKNPRG